MLRLKNKKVEPGISRAFFWQKDSAICYLGRKVTSPLVVRLLSDIENCFDFELRARLLAELACYWARTGEFNKSEKIRQDLRRQIDDGHSLCVSVLIMCIESLQLYYKDLSLSARDRMARASLLSKAAKDLKLISLTSAWLAHIDFNQSRFASMAKEIDSCLKAIESDDGAAACRVSLVLGDAFLFAGNNLASQVWYERARRLAVRIGDQASIGALNYNRAALRVASARFAGLTQVHSIDCIAMIALEVRSAINYQAIAQIKSLDYLLDTANIGALILQKKFEEARVAIVRTLKKPELETSSSQRAMLSANLAFVLAHCAIFEEAQRELTDALEEKILAFSADDRAVCFSYASEAAKLCGDGAKAHHFAQLACIAIAEHSEMLLEIQNCLVNFESVSIEFETLFFSRISSGS